MADGKGSGMPDNKLTSREQEIQSRRLDGRLSALEEKLKRKGMLKEPEEKVEKQDTPSGAAQAIKLSSEFFAAIAVGVILGLGLDQLVGTSPWGLIVFLFLGFAAGILNVLRSVGFVAMSAVEKHSALRKENKGLNKPSKRG